MNCRHWKLQRDTDGIAWATLDQAESSTNVLCAEVMAELARILDDCEREPPAALIFRSGKEAGFIAGADIAEFTRMDTPAKGRELVERGWHLYNRLAAVPYPTLALVRGHCMGGGTELALACRYCVAVDEPGTRFALPEVMLGIVPGWGGMLRLPQRVGPVAALDMMLTGKSIDARRAKRMGLADECVPPRVMENAARALALSGCPPHRPPLLQRLLNKPPLKCLLVARAAKKQVARRARQEHYPAPYAIIEMWRRYGGNALAVPAAAPTSLDALIGSATTRNLVRVFFLQERLKGFGKEAADFHPARVHVVGAGVMGGDIAAWCAQRGMTVTLQDQDVARIAPAIRRAAAAYRKTFRHERDADKQVRFALDRLIPDPDGCGVRHADVIIEAIVENLAAKQALFRAIEARAKPDAVLASNTSSLRLADIAQALAQPARLVGIHFFNPVAKMPLVEVVQGAATNAAAAQQAAAFVRKLDKLPLPVRDAPGFLVNAVLAPYLLEAMRCVDEGLAPETVDAAALAFGMPMGPLELADTVGLDVVLAAGKSLAGGAGLPPHKLAERVAAGHLGRKTGRGYYAYHDGEPVRAKPGGIPAHLALRLVGPLLEATQKCLDDGIVADADLADAGVIFGTGFAPFTGGPLNYVKNRGKLP
ncbi:MAG: 3-hydroxyacyl-CoA dehydrogenase NAD-binding domain-containing protein [Rhodocyclaceae bacterium]|nr:3-hydroxyacyl-CoA dehydrogenase NAD-binding domain-containing protein [Rhodocyclaceae bacterium]